MNCWINVDTLELLIGREGAERAQETLRQLGYQWHLSPQTRRALVHSAQVLCIAKSLPMERCLAIWDCSMIFRAAVVLFCYSMASQQYLQPDSEPASTLPYVLANAVDWNAVGLLGAPTLAAEVTPLPGTAQYFILFG